MSYPPNYSSSAHPVGINGFDATPQNHHVQVTHVPYEYTGRYGTAFKVIGFVLAGVIALAFIVSIIAFIISVVQMSQKDPRMDSRHPRESGWGLTVT